MWSEAALGRTSTLSKVPEFNERLDAILGCRRNAPSFFARTRRTISKHWAARTLACRENKGDAERPSDRR
jgi:hypothetical protein